MKETKEKLVLQVLREITEHMYEYDNFIKQLLYEALSKRTNKELKEILLGKSSKTLMVIKEEEILVCSQCGGENIEHKCWVNVNDDMVLESASYDPSDQWCRDCEAHVEFKTKDNEN